MPGSRIYNPYVGASGGGGGSDPNAEEIKTFPFAYNSSSPLTVLSIPAGARIIKTTIQLQTTFNDAAATLKIGDAVVNDRLMTVDQNIPNEIGEYQSTTPYQYVAITNLNLYMNPGTSTQGAGVVVIEYNLNN